MTMAARVLYGLAREGELPSVFARVQARTGTPLTATACIAAAVVPLALLVPLTPLAEGTSLATLAVFALVNLALLRLRYRDVRSDTQHVKVPIWIPVAGLVTCVAMMAGAFFR
jgi:amino acid transporter